MATYRVTVMVTTDVGADSDGEAMSNAIDKVRALVGDDPNSRTGSEDRDCWIVGIAQDAEDGYFVFKQEESLTN